jgi:hypothetical protein
MESLMTLQKVNSSVPELGVAMIGSGLMAKSHTMGYRNVESVYGKTPFRPHFAILADAKEDLARSGWPTPRRIWRGAAPNRLGMTAGRLTGVRR